MKKLYPGILLLIGLLIQSCSTTRLIKPLDRGETRISADLGGPMVTYPLPLSSISVGHGVKDNISIFGGIQLTSLAYNTLQVDLGANFGLLSPKKYVPGLSANVVLNPVTEFREGTFSLFPETTLNAYWNIADKHYPYIGLAVWYDPSFKTTELEKGNLIHPTLALGYNFETSRWVFGIEAKWLNFNKSLMLPQVSPTTIGGKGVAGLYLKAAYKLFKK